METRSASADDFANASYDDQLWMLSCVGARAEAARMGRGGYGDTSVLYALFAMGLYNWSEVEKPSSANVRPFRYTAVLGQELLRRIELTEDRVGCLWLIFH